MTSKLPGRPAMRSHLRHGVEADAGVVLDAPEVDLEPAVGRAQLREVPVELGDPAAEIGVLLDDDDVVAGLRRLHRRRDAGDAAADHEDGRDTSGVAAARPRAWWRRSPALLRPVGARSPASGSNAGFAGATLSLGEVSEGP